MEPETDRGASPAKPGRSVLIVEDDAGTRAALEAVFLRQGWSTSSAATVAEGLEMLALRPRCLVLDLTLPDGRGEAILRKVREDNSPVTPVVVVTGVDDPIRVGDLARLRPDLVLFKPMDAGAVSRLCEVAADEEE